MNLCAYVDTDHEEMSKLSTNIPCALSDRAVDHEMLHLFCVPSSAPWDHKVVSIV